MDKIKEMLEVMLRELLSDPEFGEGGYDVIEEQLNKTPSYIDIFVNRLRQPLSFADRESLCFIIVTHIPLASCVEFLRQDPDWDEQSFYELCWCNCEEDLVNLMSDEDYKSWLSKQKQIDNR